MSAKQFEHFLNLQQQLAGFRQSARPVRQSKGARAASGTVSAAKGWLAAAAKGR